MFAKYPNKKACGVLLWLLIWATHAFAPKTTRWRKTSRGRKIPPIVCERERNRWSMKHHEARSLATFKQQLSSRRRRSRDSQRFARDVAPGVTHHFRFEGGVDHAFLEHGEVDGAEELVILDVRRHAQSFCHFLAQQLRKRDDSIKTEMTSSKAPAQGGPDSRQGATTLWPAGVSTRGQLVNLWLLAKFLKSRNAGFWQKIILTLTSIPNTL